uniref:Ribosomal protein L34Ae n=1 Tax=Davidia involucrata TaxID=16924 RepID=A0A5B7BZN7_DAVIN
MQCSKETLVGLFYNVSSSFLLLFLFFYFTSILLAKVFHFLGGNPIFQRTHEGYEIGVFSDEEEEEEDGYFHFECTERDHLVADIIHGGEALVFLPTRNPQNDKIFAEETVNHHEPVVDEAFTATEQSSIYGTPTSESEHDEEEEIPTRDTDSAYHDGGGLTSPIIINLNQSGSVINDETSNEKCDDENEKTETDFTRDEKFLIFAPPKLERKKINEVHEEKDNEEIFGDSCTVGSTSKSSSEWRSSINYRDSGTEDPFSSSSRRSCPKWESYTVFQKYDEEMLFLDRISAQKLHETESLRSIQACPRSISERIVYKLTTKNKKSSDFKQNPYQELEGAYVAQICLTWEALNWNYKYFQRLRASRRESDPGCPAHIAQQFQQLQVLLQRYIENEPYEHGRRPEVYARMRILAPKLLQVPEYRDSDDETKEEGFRSRISSVSFLLIMEESIRTFMNFLKADRESHCQILAACFRRNRRGSIDPTRLLLMKKVNKKKQLKLKDLRRAGKCLRKRRLKEEEEMEILMALIDIKVVSRVLRMSELSEEQLHWCAEKMNKVSVGDGKLQRDSSPLFFPAH